MQDTERLITAPPLDPHGTLRFIINAGAGSVDLDAKQRVIDSVVAAAGRRCELIVARPPELARVRLLQWPEMCGR